MHRWLVRANRERANLTAHSVAPLTGCVRMNEDYETMRRVNPSDGEVCAKYYLSLAIVNDSTLPNALIGARVWLQFRSDDVKFGEAWKEMDVRHVQSETSLFPINLPPLSTCSLPLAIAAAIQGSMDGGFAGRGIKASEALPAPNPIRIELRGVNDPFFLAEFNDGGTAMVRPQPVSHAAQTAPSPARSTPLQFLTRL
jgi:hypothetical protein